MMEHFSFRHINNLQLLVCDPIERAGFKNAFSTRVGGVSLAGGCAQPGEFQPGRARERD